MKRPNPNIKNPRMLDTSEDEAERLFSSMREDYSMKLGEWKGNESMMEKIKQFGNCHYCGQTRLIEALDPDAVTQNDLDDMATASCNCPQARARRNELEQMEAAELYVNRLSEDLATDKDAPYVEDLRRGMMAAVDTVWKEGADNITFKVNGKAVKIHRTADKIKFSTSWKCSSEVEF